ncbi:MAG: hypothetical protein AAB571_10040 [Chloroflexota bacterium]
MSKKNRKNRQPNVPMQTTPVQSTQTKAGGGMIKMPSRAQSGTETINADYTHVYSDLRRIGLLASLLIAGLVVLSFFIK